MVLRCRGLWQEFEGTELGAVQQVGGSEDQGLVSEKESRRQKGWMYLWKEVGSTSRCTLARRDQPQVYHGRRYQEEVVVYGQTQCIEFGRILVI